MYLQIRQVQKYVLAIILVLTMAGIIAICLWNFRVAPLETFTQDTLFSVPYLESDGGFYTIPEDAQAQIIAALRDCDVHRELSMSDYKTVAGNTIYSAMFYGADSASSLGELIIAETEPAKIYIRDSNMAMHSYILSGEQNLDSLLPLFQALETRQIPQSSMTYTTD